MEDTSIVTGDTNQLITGGTLHCIPSGKLTQLLNMAQSKQLIYLKQWASTVTLVQKRLLGVRPTWFTWIQNALYPQLCMEYPYISPLLSGITCMYIYIYIYGHMDYKLFTKWDAQRSSSLNQTKKTYPGSMNGLMMVNNMGTNL